MKMKSWFIGLAVFAAFTFCMWVFPQQAGYAGSNAYKMARALAIGSVVLLVVLRNQAQQDSHHRKH